MVGSRQVTLSVYGQLDEVEPHEIEPFGRVRPRNADDSYVYIVGKSTSGGLVKASAPAGFAEAVVASHGDAGYRAWAWATSCLAALDKCRKCSRCEAVGADGDTKCEKCIDRDYGMERGWQRDPLAVRCRCGCWTRGPLTGEISAFEDAAEPLLGKAAEFARLPLIVLAGLR